MQLFAVVSLSINIKNPTKEAKKTQSLPSLPYLRRLSITSLSQQWGKSNTVKWKCKLAAVREEHLSVYPEHVSQADYSHGTVLERKCSNSGCAEVDYEVSNDELLKEMICQMFPLYSWQTSSLFRQGGKRNTSIKDLCSLHGVPVRVEVSAVVSGHTVTLGHDRPITWWFEGGKASLTAVLLTYIFLTLSGY